MTLWCIAIVGSLGAAEVSPAMEPSLPVRVVGAWEIAVGPGIIRVGERDVSIADPVQLAVDPPETRLVRDECYTDLPAFDSAAPGWRKGARLRPLITEECSATGLLDEATLRIKTGPGAAPVLTRGVDYELDPFWATFGRLESGNIARRQAVFVDYAYRPNRLDSVIVNAAGIVTRVPGAAGVGALRPPAVPDDAVVLANVWVPGFTDALTEDAVFPVLSDAPSPAPEAPVADRLLPNMLRKLRAGETVTIVAWGDSVTNGGGVGDDVNNWYQHQIAARLQARFPRARIRMLTAAWGGASSRLYLDAPPGGDHDFQRDVLDPKPDLVTIEFVNDAYLDEAGVQAHYGSILDRLRGIDAEVVLFT
ncbi:MAG TPA: hypothetical protein PKL84_18780, partial [Candidatus Hydrogenedentes bacterium]|nr:hypothetical protein [Candidatus Hydrogenedentota bacterium]